MIPIVIGSARSIPGNRRTCALPERLFIVLSASRAGLFGNRRIRSDGGPQWRENHQLPLSNREPPHEFQHPVMISNTTPKPANLELALPSDVADDIEELAAEDPEFITGVLQYALTRWTVARHLAAPNPGPRMQNRER